MVTLGERGQVVIPAAIRDKLELKAGDKLMVVCKDGQMIGLIPPARFRQMVADLTARLSLIDDAGPSDAAPTEPTNDKDNHN